MKRRWLAVALLAVFVFPTTTWSQNDDGGWAWDVTENDIDLARTYMKYLIHPTHKILARQQKVNHFLFKSVIETPEFGLSRQAVSWLVHGVTSPVAVAESKKIFERYEDHVPVWIEMQWRAPARNLTIPEDIFARLQLRNGDGVKFPFYGPDEMPMEYTLSIENHRVALIALFQRRVEVGRKTVDFYKDSKEAYVFIDPIAPDFPRVTFTYEFPIKYSGMFPGRPLPVQRLISGIFEQAHLGAR